MGMESKSSTSVTHWLQGLKRGDSAACQGLWDRYFSQLVQLAESKLRGIGRQADGEDVALSALKSVMLGVRADRYPQLNDSTSLWPLLVTITARKAISQVRRELAQKRGGANQVAFSDVELFVGNEATPEFAVQVMDEMENLVARLNDVTLGEIAQRKLEGATHHEIATELNCSTKTIVRKLKRIRHEWSAMNHLDDAQRED